MKPPPEIARLILERDSAREQFDRHVEWASQREERQRARALAAESRLHALEKERDEFKALASVGTWHSDCRPNRKMAAEVIQKQQAVIDKLADTIASLNAQLAALPARPAISAHHRDCEFTEGSGWYCVPQCRVAASEAGSRKGD